MDTTDDRLVFGVFVAVVIHAALILGIGFSTDDPGPRARSLEITLARFRQQDTVEDADYLAQFNQQGSGNEQAAAEPVTPIASNTDSAQIRTPTPIPSGATAVPRNRSAVVTTQAAQGQTSVSFEPERSSESAVPLATAELPADNAELASLIARLDAQQRAYAERPRIHRLTSVAARRAVDAEYLFKWKNRIETIGNKNYPVEARKRRMYGDLRLLVAVAADGSVQEIRVLESSGEKVLDDAARRIVRLAEPFESFPAELRSRADVIEIIRTWQFRRDHFSAAQ